MWLITASQRRHSYSPSFALVRFGSGHERRHVGVTIVRGRKLAPSTTTGAMTAVDQRPPAAALRGYALAIVAMEIAPRLGTASVPPDPPALSTKRALALLS